MRFNILVLTSCICSLSCWIIGGMFSIGLAFFIDAITTTICGFLTFSQYKTSYGKNSKKKKQTYEKNSKKLKKFS